jgi:hypothetical protein
MFCTLLPKPLVWSPLENSVIAGASGPADAPAARTAVANPAAAALSSAATIRYVPAQHLSI